MEISSSPKSYSVLISASNNVLTRCQSRSSSVVLTRSASCGSSLPLPIEEAGSGGVHDGGMVAAASEEEQGKKEVEMVSAAPDPDPDQHQQEEEKDAIAHPADSAKQHSAFEEVETKIKELLSDAQALHARMSQLLGPAGRHRVVTTGDAGRRRLAFVATEISFVAAYLTTLNSNLRGDGDKRGHLHHFSGEWWTWVVGLSERFLKWASNVFREIDPSCHRLLGRAAQCFRWRNSEGYSYNWIKNFYMMTEAPYSYPHLLLTSSDLGFTPQLAEAEAGALPLVGIDRPAKKILRWLEHQGTMDRNQLRVMSIVGPVGIGKTALAVELRNRLMHETIGGRYYFECNVMVQASQGTDRNILLLQDILLQVSGPATTALSSDPSQAKTMELLVRLVSECLQDMRYFIIIDDIRQESDWEEMIRAFPNTNNGSRILITTRVTSIAEACCSGNNFGLVHKMKPLNQIESERVLLAKAVGSAEGCLPHNLKLLCNEMLRRCDGTPLFLTAMADWLKEQRFQQQQQYQQEDDEEHKTFAIYCEEQVPRLPERLEQALSSAFNDFAYGDLRSLSLYMSMFPYGYKFDKDRLISKWIQEGHLFLSVHDVVAVDLSEATSIAETLFSMLVDRNVITCVASKCKHMEDEAEACQWKVNHFMHQFLVSKKFLVSKSAEMGFVSTTTTLNLLAAASPATGHGNEPSSMIPRRLALHHPDPLFPSLLETMDLSQTRSLAVSGAVSGIPLEKFANLVVLDFEGWENLTDENLLQVCRSKMFFLSYLNVRNTRVSKLPNEIKQLRILDTLDISYTHITELPLQVFELNFLRHLDLRGTRISQLPKQIVGLRDKLIRLLVGGEGTINSVETAMTHDVRRLYQLKTLATVDLTEQPASFIRALGDLCCLRAIAFIWSFHQSTDKDSREALLSSIRNWEDLESLTIHCGLGCSMEFLGSLEKSRVPRWLEKFKVTAGRFASVPRWIDGLEHLAFVQITVCNKQSMADLKILGALPKLQCLILGLDSIPGQPIVIGNEGFRELQMFSIYCPMPWLTFSTGAMQKMTYLQLKFCSTPASQVCVPSGISNLGRLTEVSLCYNPKYVNSPSIKMTVEAVSKQITEHRNPIDLFINGIEQDDVQQVDDEVTQITIGTSSRTNAGAEDDAQAVSEEATAVVQCEITEAES